MSDENHVAPAGWYPDPTNGGRQRWWDGTTWSDQFADGPSSADPSQPAGEISWWSKVPMWVKVAVPAGIVVVVLVIVLVAVSSQPSRFEAALESCDLTDNSFARIGDNGTSLILDMEGEGDGESGLRLDDFVCVLIELEASDVVVEQMSSTRALDGRQSGEWDGIEATWSYHPDSGLDVILVQK